MKQGLFEKLKQQNLFIEYHFITIIVFSLIYYVIGHNTTQKQDQQNFKKLSDCVYYSVVTHFTVGFGDIAPSGGWMRLATVLQIICAFTLMAI